VLEKRQNVRLGIMSKINEINEMRVEYDFSNAKQGQHHKAYVNGTNLIVLDSDVMLHFKNSESVNRALRMLINLAENEVRSN